MTEPAERRHPIEGAVPEWKHPVDPIETRISPDGQVAVRLVWDPSGGDEPTTRWIRVSSPCGQITVELLEDDVVADWRVC